jgi:uncharacterized integral membrane protein
MSSHHKDTSTRNKIMPGFKPYSYRQWTFSCAAGEFIGIAVAAAVAVGHFRLAGEPVTTSQKAIAMLVMLGAGAVEGTMITLFQWRVLRHSLPRLTLRRWAVVTIAAAVTGWFLGMLPSLLMSDDPSRPAAPAFDPPLWLVGLLAGASGLVFGAMFGWIQWLELRKHLPKAGKWIVANMWGWGLGITWIYLAATLPDETTPIGVTVLLGAMAGALAGLSVGAITGLSLKVLLQGNAS